MLEPALCQWPKRPLALTDAMGSLVEQVVFRGAAVQVPPHWLSAGLYLARVITDVGHLLLAGK